MMEEIWKSVKGFEGLYEVSNMGRIKSLHRVIMRSNGKKQSFQERILKGVISDYYQVFLSKNGKSFKEYIHRIVATHFIPNPENKPQVNHKNSNRFDNRSENLEWVTVKENHTHALKFGYRAIGSNHPQAKTIYQYTKDRVFVREWGCSVDIKNELGFKQGNISSACLGKFKTSKGFIWTYAKYH